MGAQTKITAGQWSATRVCGGLHRWQLLLLLLLNKRRLQLRPGGDPVAHLACCNPASGNQWSVASVYGGALSASRERESESKTNCEARSLRGFLLVFVVSRHPPQLLSHCKLLLWQTFGNGVLRNHSPVEVNELVFDVVVNGGGCDDDAAVR